MIATQSVSLAHEVLNWSALAFTVWEPPLVAGALLLAGLAFVLVYAVVGGHTAWMLRPFVVRPQTRAVPFVRPVEHDLAWAVRGSARSAVTDVTLTIVPDHGLAIGGGFLVLVVGA